MNRTLYTLLYYLLLPFIFIRLLLRSRKAPDYAQRWGERLGYFDAPKQQGGIWVHSVSVGETIAAAPLVKQLQQTYPEVPVIITTMTPTGSERVRALFGDSVFHVYVPYDTPGAVKRFLSATRPRLALIMETELWPNIVKQCRRMHIPLVIANARLSARSAHGYARFPKLVGSMLRKVSLVAAQNEDDGERFIALGLKRGALQITGSVKFDISIAESVHEQASRLRQTWGNRKVWIAASTHEGEEEIILAAHRKLLQQWPDLLLLLVPRHPERFDKIATLCWNEGFDTVRRSLDEPVTDVVSVMLGDTMGELLTLYAAADIAFVGGSLVETGGHNFLEPAALGLPVISGPHVFNFTEISRILLATGAMCQVENADQLEQQVADLLADSARAESMGRAGLSVVEANRGAQQKLMELISGLL